MKKHYGLMGKTIKARYRQENSDCYPWHGSTVPVLITDEYDEFLAAIKAAL